MAKREFKTYRTEEKEGVPETVVEAHEVTEDTAGEVRTVNGVADARPGEYLVKSYRPDEYQILTKDQFKDSGFKADDDKPTSTEPVVGTPDPNRDSGDTGDDSTTNDANSDPNSDQNDKRPNSVSKTANPPSRRR